MFACQNKDCMQATKTHIKYKSVKKINLKKIQIEPNSVVCCTCEQAEVNGQK